MRHLRKCLPERCYFPLIRKYAYDRRPSGSPIFLLSTSSLPPSALKGQTPLSVQFCPLCSIIVSRFYKWGVYRPTSPRGRNLPALQPLRSAAPPLREVGRVCPPPFYAVGRSFCSVSLRLLASLTPVSKISSLTVLLFVLFAIDLMVGAADIPLSALWSDGLEHRIMMQLRLPKAITAVLAGVGLSLSGLQMQTLFRNPLAGPSVLGVSSGATLGVALLVMLGSVFGFNAGSSWMVVFAVLGAMGILLLILGISFRVQGSVTLLIVGMMIGSVAGALVNVLQNFADPDSLKLYITWTLGSLAAVGWSEMRWLLALFIAGLALAIALIKPLNGLQLGEDYAASLGIPIRTTRTIIILSTGLLAGGITAFCGPIAFVGVAVPHIARGLMRTSNHRLTLPASALVGANLLLLCDIISYSCTYPLPISTVSALFGAPIVLWVILKK